MNTKWTTAGKVLILKSDTKLIGLHDVGVAAPSNPEEGQGWYDSTNNIIGFYNGTDWYSSLKINNLKMKGSKFTDDSDIVFAYLLSGKFFTTLPGYAANRTNCIAYSDANTITIPGNCLEVDGKLCWWDATITFDLGSGGSNAGSTDLGANEWHYIYVDHSSVTSGTELVAANFINNKTAPGARSTSKLGYYNGSDRCIGCVRTDGSNNILEFHWLEGVYEFVELIRVLTVDPADSNWHTVDCSGSIPNFGRMMGYFEIYFYVAATGQMNTFWRTYGETPTSDRNIITTTEATLYAWIKTNTSQVIEYKGTSGIDDIIADTVAFKLTI